MEQNLSQSKRRVEQKHISPGRPTVSLGSVIVVHFKNDDDDIPLQPLLSVRHAPRTTIRKETFSQIVRIEVGKKFATTRNSSVEWKTSI